MGKREGEGREEGREREKGKKGEGKIFFMHYSITF